MRFKYSVEQEVYLQEATNTDSVELVYAGLDIFGSTPWKMNKAVFYVVIRVWRELPPAVYNQPEDPSKENDMEAKSHHIGRHKLWVQLKANNRSDRCSINYKIEIARAVTYLKILGFRGRAYPIPPHLNHIGGDLSRGLLRFADAKFLGPRGFCWIEVHLANLYGYDKANFDERVWWMIIWNRLWRVRPIPWRCVPLF